MLSCLLLAELTVVRALAFGVDDVVIAVPDTVSRLIGEGEMTVFTTAMKFHLTLIVYLIVYFNSNTLIVYFNTGLLHSLFAYHAQGYLEVARCSARELIIQSICLVFVTTLINLKT